jgi:DNA transposition AAA+ family ATPase
VQRAHLDEVQQQEQEAEEERQRRIFTELDWFATRIPEEYKKPKSRLVQLSIDYDREIRKIADPTTLVIIDEADRLKMNALEQVRDIFDKGGIGVVFIGMPGIEKRLSRYPQLYSRVGFVHAFCPLSAAQVRNLSQQKWMPSGVALPEKGVVDQEALAAIIRVTGGNFRLLHRLLTQIARLVEINALQTVTSEVVEAARERLVIGTA